MAENSAASRLRFVPLDDCADETGSLVRGSSEMGANSDTDSAI